MGELLVKEGLIRPDDIHLFVAGGEAGRFSAFLPILAFDVNLLPSRACRFGAQAQLGQNFLKI